jgi:hypothetical protein
VPDFCALWRAFNAVAGDRWRRIAVAPLAHRTVRCTPDSPVNYSGAPLDFPEGEEFSVKSPGAPDTVGGTPDSPVRQTRAAFGYPLLSLLNLILGLFIG